MDILSAKLVGEKRNVLKLLLGKGSRVVEAVWFNPRRGLDPEYLIKKTVTLLYHLRINKWQERETLELRVKDIFF
jgi:hypothetical protein